MVFKKKQYRKIRLAVHPRAPFRKVLRILEELELPNTGISADHVKYALLEMISNSLRAHRSHEVEENIHICFELLDEPQDRIQISVLDKGHGFDPDSLPYSLDDDPESIDLNSTVFQEYRRRNNYERFGMGLPLVLRTFDTFAIEFKDPEGNPISWHPDRVRGTTITVSRIVVTGKSNGE